MRKVISAGGVLVRSYNGKKQLIQIIFKHTSGITFPKGHVENGESFEQAALREVLEETGILGLKIVRKMGVITRKSTEIDGTVVMKDIHLFLMTGDNLEKQTKNDEDWNWFDIEDALEKNQFPQEKDFILKLKDNIEYEFWK